MIKPSFAGKCLALFALAQTALIASAADNTQLGLPLDSEPFASKGDVVVTQAELDAYLARIPDEHRGSYLRNNKRLGKTLDDLILIRLLAHEGLEAGLLDEPVVQGSLHQSAMVYLAEEYRKDYLEERLLDDYSTPARELYLTQSELFEKPRSFTFTHVLVMRGGKTGELDAMEKIFSVYEELQDGADLDALVSEYSEDPNAAENNGQYANVTAEELDRNVAVAVQAMQPGQISEPVFSSSGWHIIRLDEKQPAETMTWEEAEEQAHELARNRHQTRLIETLYRDLLNSAELVIEPGAVEALMQRYGVEDADRPSSETLTEQSQEATSEE